MNRRLRIDPVAAILAVFGAFIALLVIGSMVRTEKDTEKVTAASSTVTPEPTVQQQAQQLKLALRDEHLTDIQQKYQQMSLILPRYPQYYGLLDKPAVEFTDNEATLFAALIGTEASWNHYEPTGSIKVSSAGCLGIGQICNRSICGGVTEDEVRSDVQNMYHAACYLKDLINQYGDWEVAIAVYKGAWDGYVTHPEQVNSVFDHVKLTGGQ